MRKRIHRTVPAAPALLAPSVLTAAIVLAIYGETAIHWTAVLRPMVTVASGATILTLMLWGALRRPLVASALTCLLLAVLFAQTLIILVSAGLMIAVIGARMWRLYRGRASGPVPPSYVLAPTLFLFVVSVLNLAVAGVVTAADFRIARSPTAAVGSPQAKPNIYVLLLDGYPRGDTLSDLGYDNEPFLDALETAGLRVNHNSTTTYARTELTLAAMTSGRSARLDEWAQISGWPEVLRPRREARRTYLVNMPIMDDLRRLGYAMAYVPSPVMHTDWLGWDERRDGGHLTDFEVYLLQRTPLHLFLGEWVMNQQRKRVDHALAQWSLEPRAQQFVFAHLMVPHPPFLWGPGGAARGPLPCWYASGCNLYHARAADLHISEAAYADLLADQLDATNERVLAAIRRIVTSDPDALIVVFSDHGARHSLEQGPEWHRNLFAARGPVDSVEELFGQLLAAVTH